MKNSHPSIKVRLPFFFLSKSNPPQPFFLSFFFLRSGRGCFDADKTLRSIGSEEELKDLCEHYQTFEGDLPKILDHTLCATDADEPRLIKLIDQAIQDGTLTSNSRWKTTKSDKKARSKRSKAAAREAAEAEALAQELGVKKPTDGSEDSLRALIQAKSAGRHQSLVAKLEAKARAADQDQSQKKSKSKKKRAAEPDEPTDEEFQRIQAEMDARRTNAESSSTSTKTSKPRKKTKS